MYTGVTRNYYPGFENMFDNMCGNTHIRADFNQDNFHLSLVLNSIDNFGYYTTSVLFFFKSVDFTVCHKNVIHTYT